MKRHWLTSSPEMASLLLTAALATGLALSGCTRSTEAQDSAEADKEAQPAASVQTVIAGPKTLQPVVQFVGRVRLDPADVATVSARSECVVQSLPVAEGQHVAKDAAVVEMDRRPFEYEAARAAATLAKARAAAALLEAGPRQEEIEVARQEVRSRQLDLASAQDVAKGKAQLRMADVVSAVESQEAQRRLDAAEAALKAAQAKLALLEKGPRPEEIAEAQAELHAATADDAMARFRLDRCEVRAPIEGELVKLSVHPGMALAVGAPVAEIVDLRRVLIEGAVPLSRLADVQVGAKATVTSAAWPDEPFQGKVVRIAHRAESDSGDLAVWIAVDNPAQRLRPEMVVRVSMDARPVEADVAVPESAVIEQDGQWIAMVVRDGKTHNVPVRLGRHVDAMVQVLDGVHAGDMVITRGGYGLPEEYPVAVGNQADPGDAHSDRPASGD